MANSGQAPPLLGLDGSGRAGPGKGKGSSGRWLGPTVYVRGSPILCLPAPRLLMHLVLRGTLLGQGPVRTKVSQLWAFVSPCASQGRDCGFQSWKRVMALALGKDAIGHETLCRAPSCVVWAGSAMAAQGRGPLDSRLGTDLVFFFFLVWEWGF